MKPARPVRAPLLQTIQYLWQEWFSSVALALLLTQFGATAVRVDGASMMPGLRHGESLLIPKAEGWMHHLGLGGYHRGDIVVFKPPRNFAAEWRRDYRGLMLPWAYRPYLVKRVVGVPGDRVQVRGGVLYVNAQAIAETRTLNYWNEFCHDTASVVANMPTPVTVPAGKYFVMGDNRSPGGSLDSRIFGPVAVQDIAGRAIASIWPLAAKAQATPPCDGLPNPQQRVTVSGPAHWNPRWLIGGP